MSRWLSTFLKGMLLAGFVHGAFGGACSSSTTPDAPVVDVAKINEGAQNVETAFASGDLSKVQTVLTETARAVHKDDLASLTADNMRAFAADFKARSLDHYSKNYAEFSFPWKDTRYIVSFARQDDGSYKLRTF